MNILYLGTAAAEGYPAIFCQCERCKEAKKRGGKNIRTRSQALIDGKILIDFNADTYWHSIEYGINLADIKTLLITHIHEDHFYVDDMMMRRFGFAKLDSSHKLNIYGSVDIIKPLDRKEIQQTEPGYGCVANAVLPYQPFFAEDYKITALKAEHGTPNPYIYIVQKDGKSLLYAHDTGIFPEETMKYIAESGIKFNLVSLDCTAGMNKIEYPEHMNFERNIIIKDKLTEIGAVDEKTRIVLNHFSHNAIDSLYDDFTLIAGKYGFEVSYDGMKVEF